MSEKDKAEKSVSKTLKCAKCGVEGTSDGRNNTAIMYRCTQCKKTRYCGAECQRSDWVNHRPLCERTKDKPDELSELDNSGLFRMGGVAGAPAKKKPSNPATISE
eukprot:gb/GEZN01016922.1/.p1 GENE.gb/GEZN01016922.1/~~gb/GEZN01016922.1/.p1  ORF type:complete len:105 (+),score=16.10 gb/GEZN01016922.1/:154-468(+)